jgi:hypothetical protein
MTTPVQQFDFTRSYLDYALASADSFEYKMGLLEQIESTIEIMYQVGATTIKPIYLMTDDDLVH